jgi:outer membrane receptor protein involved in Fe transport
MITTISPAAVLHLRAALVASTVLSAGLLAMPAAAQNEAQGSGLRIEEIVVTARKVEESLQQAPVTVSAFTGDAIRAAGISNISELADYTPGLFFQKDQGRRFDRPVIRGMSNILGEGNVAYFIDGAYVGSSIQGTDVQSVERIEIIKGPQSALFGRATFAGAINYVSRKPTNEFEGRVDATVAEHSEFDFSGYVSGPILVDKLFFFASARVYSKDGEWTNFDGRSIGGEKTKSGSIALTARPIETLEITARLSYAEDEDESPPNSIQTRFFNNCFLNVGIQYYCGEVQSGPIAQNLDRLQDPGLNRENWRTNVQANWDIADWTVTGVFGYNDNQEVRGFDADFQNFRGGIPAGQTHRRDESFQEEYSYELRVSSPQENRLRALAGVFYLESESGAGIDDPYTRFRTFPVESQTNPALRLQDAGIRKVRNLAGFASLSFDVTETIAVTAEVRRARDKLFRVAPTSATNPTLRVQEASFKSTLPRFTANWQATDDLLLYAIAAKGNKPGGFNGNPLLPANLQAYDEESAWNYEAGVKATVLDGQAIINAAGFYMDWKGQQLTNNFQPAVGTPLSYIANVGDVEVTGFEVEGQVQITAQLQARAGYSYTHTKYVDGFVPEQIPFNGTGSLVGNEVPRSPKHLFNAGLTWRDELTAGLDYVLRGDVTYRSKSFVQVHNLAILGDRTVANFRAGVEAEAWELTFFVKNVFNNKTPAGATRYVDFQNDRPTVPGFDRAFLITESPGRQFGVQASYRF